MQYFMDEKGTCKVPNFLNVEIIGVQKILKLVSLVITALYV
jgi:hypothetical protein